VIAIRIINFKYQFMAFLQHEMLHPECGQKNAPPDGEASGRI
jgi:hypothetical protein